MATEKIGVVIGRFQVPELTEGHKALIETVAKNHQVVAVLVGTRLAPHNRRHPLNFQVRKHMIESGFPKAIVLPVVDNPSDEVWSKSVDDLLNEIFPFQQKIIYTGRDGFNKAYSGKCEVKQVVVTNDYVSGTKVREDIINGQPVNSPDFRKGIVYAMGQRFPQVFITVDIALVNDDNQVLLGRKHNSNQWRFPGGFVDAKDKTFEDAAKRELAEETNVYVDYVNYIDSFSIDDWRSRDSEDTFHKTVFYLAKKIMDIPRAGDDLVEVKWFNLNTLKNAIDSVPINLTANHLPLWSSLWEYLYAQAHNRM